MLVLARKVGEEIVIGQEVRITVVCVRPGLVRLGLTAPPNIPVARDDARRGPRGRGKGGGMERTDN